MAGTTSSTQHVLALDPGEKVGWARGHVRPDGEIEDLGHGITGLRDMALALGENIGKYDVVVYETWRLRPDMARKFVGSDFQPVQFIGAVRYLAWIHPQVKLVSQGASIKSTADKTMSPQLQEVMARMPASHDDAHDGDAIRHLWHWTWNNVLYPS